MVRIGSRLGVFIAIHVPNIPCKNLPRKRWNIHDLRVQIIDHSSYRAFASALGTQLSRYMRGEVAVQMVAIDCGTCPTFHAKIYPEIDGTFTTCACKLLTIHPTGRLRACWALSFQGRCAAKLLCRWSPLTVRHAQPTTTDR